MNDVRRLRLIRHILGSFIFALVLIGLTAFPLPWEVRFLTSWFGSGTFAGSSFPGLAHWLSYVREGLETTALRYPFLAYGTGWLAFAHLVIAVAFLGPLKNPVRNIWVVKFGIIACLAVIPMAPICGAIRGIPFFWRIIDCSFRVVGSIPLAIARSQIRLIQKPPP
jgi:hypothetical protein